MNPQLHNTIESLPRATTRHIYFDDTDTSLTDPDKEQLFIEIPNVKAIINPESEKVYGVLSDRYRIVQHEEVLIKIEESLQNYPEYGEPLRDIKTYQDGAKLHAKYTFPEIEVEIKTGDKVNPQIDVRNGYDGQWGFHVLFGAFRLVCSNGLVIGEKTMEYKRKHFDNAREILMTDILDKSLNSFSNQTEIWKSWINKTIEKQEIEIQLENLKLRDYEKEEIVNETETESGETLMTVKQANQWLLYAVITQYVTHKVKTVSRQLELQNRIRKLY